MEVRNDFDDDPICFWLAIVVRVAFDGAAKFSGSNPHYLHVKHKLDVIRTKALRIFHRRGEGSKKSYSAIYVGKWPNYGEC